MKRTVAVIALGILAGCGGGGGSSSSGSAVGAAPPAAANSAPTANAGPAQTVNVGALVTLNGSGSTDPDKDTLSYAWQLAERPAGSAASLPASAAIQPTFTPDKPGDYVATLVVSDGKSSSTPSRITVTAKSVGFSSLPPAEPLVEKVINDWLISRSTSALTGKTSVTLTASSLGGDFVINCHGDGSFNYYFATSAITGDGLVAMRIGANPVVLENWTESRSSFRILTPPKSDIALLKKLYKNWDFVFQYDVYAGGARTVEVGASGLSSAIDKTRADCKWSTEDFPPQNGWGKALPLVPPDEAVEASYSPDFDVSDRVRMIAWRATNALGKTQLLVRVGDAANTRALMGMSDKRLYVIQDDKVVSAVSGYDFSINASTPVILALNGDFDASRPLTLTLVKFHFHTTDQLVPMAFVDMD